MLLVLDSNEMEEISKGGRILSLPLRTVVLVPAEAVASAKVIMLDVKSAAVIFSTNDSKRELILSLSDASEKNGDG